MDGYLSTPDAISMELGEDYPELRDSVRRVCQRFPGEYWRKLDEEIGRAHV